MSPERPRHSDIDSLDRQILRLLRDDARRPNSEVARLTGASVPTVRRRLERLRETGILRVIGLLDPVATGFPVDVFLALKVRHGVAAEVARRLAAVENVAFVGHTTGRFNMLVDAFFRDTVSLLDFCTQELTLEQGVLSAETYHILAIDKFNYMWELPGNADEPSLRNGGSSVAPRVNHSDSVEIDQVDRRIIRLLKNDGRRSNAQVAREVGVSEPTVRKRIERLKDAGVLRIIGLLDPAATGFPVYAMILIEVTNSAIRQVGARLAGMERVAYVSYITGPAQIWCEAMLPSNEALYSFLTRELTGIEGIVSTEAVQVLAIEKFNYMWELPEASEG
jgi:DNA-binding Lrp family transcriptional regulator